MATFNRYYNNNNNESRKRKNTDTDSTYDDEYKKQRTEDENVVAEDALEACLSRVGEQNEQNLQTNFSVEINIEQTASYVCEQLIDKRERVISCLLDCVQKLPEKLSVYASLVGLLNIKNPNFVESFLDGLATDLKNHAKAGNLFYFHRLTRFLNDLVNVRVITTHSLLNILEQFVSVTKETDTPQVRSDFYVYCVLSSLPWSGKMLYEKHGPAFDEILDAIKAYIDTRKKDYLHLIKVWSSDDPHPQEEIKKLEEDDWLESQIYRPYRAFENTLAMSSPHDFPLIVPPEYYHKSVFPLPRAIFRMFDYTDVPEEFIMPGARSIERFLVEEQLHSVLNTYYLDRKLCAAKLLKLKITSRIPLNYIIVEILLGQLLMLPKSPQIEVFYGSILLELCKLQPEFMPLVLAQATELIFDRLDTMKVSCIERFASWFAYNLSNFQYKWSWDDWKECVLNEDLESPKNKFLRETLIRCMRLAYHQRIVEMIPASMTKVLPKAPKPLYKYESEGAEHLEGTLVANKVLELFKERAMPETVFQLLRDIDAPKPSDENEEDMKEAVENEINTILKIEVFTSTLLYFGSKSFSHTFAVLAKYHMIFKMLMENETCQLAVLRALYDVWRNHQQMMVVLVDKMLKTQIVDCSSVARWIFSDAMRVEFTSFYVWEIMHVTINRMSKHVHKLQSEYDSLSEKIGKTSAPIDTDDAEPQVEVTEEELEQKLQSLDDLKNDQKALFHLILKHFVDFLSEQLSKPDIKTEEGQSERNPYLLKWTIERFEDILLTHNEEILPHYEEFKSSLITSSTPKVITKTFRMFGAFKK